MSSPHQPSLDRITIFPIKGFAGHHLEQVEVLPGGALAGDRRFALQDLSGQFISGKKHAGLHRIHSSFGSDLHSVVLSCDGNKESFALEPGNQLLAEWCSQMLGQQCQLIENTEAGFPDDCESPGPTLISTASLLEVANWFGRLDLEEARTRFRMNLEVGSELPFWEDRLVGDESKESRFRIGETVWQGRGICQRCVVPTRNSSAGTVDAGFAREFSLRREETLPEWSPRQRFDHFYRLGINTALESLEQGKILSIGDEVEAID